MSATFEAEWREAGAATLTGSASTAETFVDISALDAATDYEWRVRYTGGAWTEWQPVTTLVACVVPARSGSAFGAMERAVFGTFGVSAVHTRAAVNTPCTVVIDYNLVQFGDQINVNNASALVHVRQSEIASKPKRGDYYTLENSQVLRVDATPIYDGRVWGSTVVIE